MTSHRAECSCGRLSAICAGEPMRVAVCHCMACKRRTGSAFGFGAWYREADVVTSGSATEFVRIGDEGSRLAFGFCPNCATTLFWRNDKLPDVVAVAAGAFADLAFPTPSVSVYHESRKYPWVEILTEPLETRG